MSFKKKGYHYQGIIDGLHAYKVNYHTTEKGVKLYTLRTYTEANHAKLV